MQENLLFFGINEAELTNSHPEDASGERDQPAENTENILRDFLVHVLKIDRQTEGQIKFDRVHRLGKRKRQRNNPRPIVAKFENYTESGHGPKQQPRFKNESERTISKGDRRTS